MRIRAVVGIVLVAVLLQVALARYAVGGRFVFDLVLVGVIFAALQGGTVAGMLGGTIGGLLQDAASGGVVGLGGLVKTLVGAAAGAVGTQFVVAKPLAKTAIVAGATLTHAALRLLLQGVIDQQWPGVGWADMLEETLVNSIAGFLAFSAIEALPSAIARGRARTRSRLSRRQW